MAVGSMYENSRVHIDSEEFRSCVFNNCELVYSGGPVVLDSNTFRNCRWALEGPAASTLKFLQALHAAGGDARELVENTLAMVTGKKPRGPRLN